MDSPKRAHLLDLTLDGLVARFTELDLPSYRARQVMQWVYEHFATSFEQMTSLPVALRRDLAQRLAIYTSEVVSDRQSTDGTRKLLLRWPDGASSECVLIPEPDRNTACVSSQVGCPVRCTFCASGCDGLERQLTPGEIVEQAMRLAALCRAPESVGQRPAPGRAREEAVVPPAAPRGARLSHVVFMGIGEPLANYEAVLTAVRILHSPWALNLGARKITISTVGLPTQIRRLAAEGLQVNLAISLHATTDDLRQRLIPWARRVTIPELVDAARCYFERTGREVTLEYVMLAGVNMRPIDVERFARITRQLRCNVNLIPYNPVGAMDYERPSDIAVREFVRALRRRGVNAHVRKSRGADIDAACGQLRRVLSVGRSSK